MSDLRRRFVFGTARVSSMSPDAIGYLMCRSELNSASPGTMVIDKDSDIWVKQDHVSWELTAVVLKAEDDECRLPGNASPADIKTSFAKLDSTDSHRIRSSVVTDADALAQSKVRPLEQISPAPMAYGPVRYLGDATEAFLGRR